MVVMMLYENESEKRQHLSAIQALTFSLGMSENIVRELYENELQSMIARASVRDFLSVIVIRRIREKIQNNRWLPDKYNPLCL
jgi:hypothetical protein